MGADEVGLGCIAGPVVVCAVSVPTNWIPPAGLRDSKKLSPQQRDELEHKLRYCDDSCVLPNFAVVKRLVVRSNDDIDERGMRSLLTEMFGRAVLPLTLTGTGVEEAIIDGDIPFSFARSVPKADDTFPSVMAASVLAKTYRDRLMRLYDTEIPGYGFGVHKGYPTKDHLAALRRLGPSRIHRKTFGPVAALLRGKDG